jgi:hypothetical protein
MTIISIEDKVFQIHNGPSKFDLSTSLFHGGNGERIPVTFHINEGSSGLAIRVFMESLEREDGSGESYNFRACFFKQVLSVSIASSPLLQMFLAELQRNPAMLGRYDSRTRKGTVSLAPLKKKFVITQIS